MNIHSAASDYLMPNRALATYDVNSDMRQSAPQALASNQSRAQEALTEARELQTQRRVQAEEQVQSMQTENSAYEQYLQTGRLDVFA